MPDSAGPQGGQTQWWRTLPPAETEIACGDGRHPVRWADGSMVLPAHGDPEAELVLAALGGGKPECVELAELWTRHHDDVEVLTLGPRWDGDEVPVTREDAEALRARRRGPAIQPHSVPMRPGPPGFVAGSGSGGWGPVTARVQITQARGRQIELMSLLALGPAFQMRLTASVAAAWQGKAGTSPDEVERRSGAVLEAALTGRFALAVESWLGIDADLVTARPHSGPGWGAVELTEPGGHAWRRGGHGLRASLPVGWLAGVWAAGLAVVGRHLVVAVQEARWPDARVLALRAPGAEPVTLEVRATDGDGAHWVITDTGEEAVRT